MCQDAVYLRVCVCVYPHVQSLSQGCELFHAVSGPLA